MTYTDKIKLIKQLEKVVSNISRMKIYFGKQQYYVGFDISKQLVNQLLELMNQLHQYLTDINERYMLIDLGEFVNIFQELQITQENKNYVYLMDIYELRLLPVLKQLLETLVLDVGTFLDEDLIKQNFIWCKKSNIDLRKLPLLQNIQYKEIERDHFSKNIFEQLEKIVEKCRLHGYMVEVTSSGLPTLVRMFQGEKTYFHTNGMIVEEAVLLGDEWLNQNKEEYIFYGLGLGYPYFEMLSRDQNITIEVIESNLYLLTLAILFAPLGKMCETGRFNLTIDLDYRILQDRTLTVQKEKGTYIFYPALTGIEKETVRQQLELYFVNESSIRTQARDLLGNFRRNVKTSYKSIHELQMKGKRVILVAAGPSLDKNIGELRNCPEDVMIIAVGTVLKKMLALKIIPDYVIIADAGKGVYKQIDGILDCKVPLIFLSTVFSRVVSDYKAEKYILCQQGFEEAEELAHSQGWSLIESGGSVITAAFDLCLKLRASCIVCIGMDFAYTDGVDHASETPECNMIKESKDIQWVTGYNGEMIQTAKNLKIYLEWIERRIERRTDEERKIVLIDATEGGAKKNGMAIMKLRDALR